jgi:hypothetical protein
MALFVSNPRGKNGRFKAKSAKKSAPKARRARKSVKRASNPRAGAVVRRRRTAKGRMKAVSHRKRAVRTMRRAANPARRLVKRHRARKPRRVARRSRRARNALTLSNPMSGIPVIGTAVSMIGPALFGALGVEAIGQTTGMLKKYVSVPTMIEPYEYTIGGLLLAGVVQLITPIPAPIRHSLGVGLASAGGAVDWFRYRSASGAYGDLTMGDLTMGDGGSWSVEFGDDEAYGALSMSGIDFSGDEDFCGEDFSVAEGEAAAEGYGEYMRRFPVKRPGHARNVPPHMRHDPRREGDRFHWLAKLVGPQDFRRIANMAPEPRLAMIRACKAACKNAVRGVLSNAVKEGPRLLTVDAIESQGSNLPDPHTVSVPFAQQDQFGI